MTWLGCFTGITHVYFVCTMPTQAIICGKPTKIPSMWLEQQPPSGYHSIILYVPQLKDHHAQNHYDGMEATVSAW